MGTYTRTIVDQIPAATGPSVSAFPIRRFVLRGAETGLSDLAPCISVVIPSEILPARNRPVHWQLCSATWWLPSPVTPYGSRALLLN